MTPFKIKFSMSLKFIPVFLLFSILSSAQIKNKNIYLMDAGKIPLDAETDSSNSYESDMFHGINMQGVVGFIGTYSFNESGLETGSFYVAQFNCTNRQDKFTTTQLTEQTNKHLKTLCFPNPVYDQLTVVSLIDGSFQITDNLSKIILQGSIQKDIPYTFQFPDYTNGLYVLHVLDKNENIHATKKIIKVSH